ncbi:MAG: hypothetical protein ACPGXK_07605, partial [Phycisphaerae bacterium]
MGAVVSLAGQHSCGLTKAFDTVSAYCERIEKHNDDFGAFVAFDSDKALEAAAALDNRVAAGEKVG